MEQAFGFPFFPLHSLFTVKQVHVFFLFFLFYVFFRVLRLLTEHSTAVYHRSKLDLKYYNLAVSAGRSRPAPASMWALLHVSLFFGS